MKKFKFRKNMFSRMIISTLPFMFFIILIVIILLSYINIMDFRKLFNSNTSMLMNIVAKDSEYALLTNNLENFSKMADQLTANRQIEYIQMFNKENKKIFMKLPENSQLIPEVNDSVVQMITSTETIHTIDASGETPFIVDYYIPVFVETESVMSEELFAESSGQTSREFAGFIQIGVNYADTYRVVWKSAWISAVILLASLFIFLILLRSLYAKFMMPINKINSKLDFTLSGKANLSERLTFEADEEYMGLINNFNKLLSMLASITSEITNVSTNLSEHIELLTSSSEELTASSEEITSTIQQITNNSGEQARSIDEIATSSNVTVKNIQQSVQKTEENEKFSSNILSISINGKSLAKNAVDKIDNLRSSSQKLYMIINDVNEKQSRISSITDTIEAITKRTNILSLNASIEAARAGEYGRGFQVVAEEIRKLAEKSSEAAIEIHKIIMEVSTTILTLINESKENEEMMNEGKDIILSTSNVLEEISNNINYIVTNNKNISTEIKNAEHSIMDISNVLNEIAKFAEGNAASSEEMSASVEQEGASIQELASSAQQLHEIILKLQDIVKKLQA